MKLLNKLFNKRKRKYNKKTISQIHTKEDLFSRIVHTE